MADEGKPQPTEKNLALHELSNVLVVVVNNVAALDEMIEDGPERAIVDELMLANARLHPLLIRLRRL